LNFAPTMSGFLFLSNDCCSVASPLGQRNALVIELWSPELIGRLFLFLSLIFSLTFIIKPYMMKLLVTLTFLIFSGVIFSQDCSNYFYLQNNKKIEMTITNKKGNESGKMTYTISDSKKNGNSTTATLNSEFVDAKGKSI